MEYNFSEIEKKWQQYWKDHKTYKVEIDENKPKYYVLDMFPYPSGAGLHVGHPLGYIASDIYARYKRLKGFNVLHPMGYDAYGLPAEQYAIQTGQHPSITTEQNIARYREQLDKIGFSFDWEREIRTCDPEYYKWTQWTFIQMFNSFYNYDLGIMNYKFGAAQAISELIRHFEKYGTENLNVAQTEELHFTANEWKSFDEKRQQEILMNYRIAYLAEISVNWSPDLGTVLANDEVSNGLSVRGGYPVEQRKMKQWCLRVSAYAERLLNGLDAVDWTESLKEAQRNWIGRSEGAEMLFAIARHCGLDPQSPEKIKIFTTRADTIYGVTFMVLAPESELVEKLTTVEQKSAVAEYISATKKRTERERIADKKVSGVFSGSYAINPISGKEIPIWISDYVLAGYGTGAIMAVPAHDSRDYAFAKHFNLPIIPLIEGADVSEESFEAKEGTMVNSPDHPLTPSKGGGGCDNSIVSKHNNAPGYFTTDRLNWNFLIDHAKAMRSAPTKAESVLWNLIRDKKLGYRFRRQHPISKFIPDFVCLEKKLIIEVDGDYHLTEKQQELDAARTYLLEKWGYKIIRFSNDYVINGYKFVEEKIVEELRKIKSENIDETSDSVLSLPFGEGRGGVLTLNGLSVKDAIDKTKKYIIENDLGKVKVNYRLRDAIFSRQRYWGEPFPIYYKDGMPYAVAEKDLPIELPEIDKFLPTETGEPPLGRAKNWDYEVKK